MCFNFALECVIRKVQEPQAVMKINRAYELLICADVNMLGYKINAIKENIGSVVCTGNDAGLKVNLEKTTYVLMCK